METQVIKWTSKADVELLLEAMKAPVKRDAQPVAKPAMVVLQSATETETSAEESFSVVSL